MERQSIQIRKILRSPSVKRKNKTVPVSERVSKQTLVFVVVNSLFCEGHHTFAQNIFDSANKNCCICKFSSSVR